METKYVNMADSIVSQYVREYDQCRFVVDCYYGRFVGNSPQSIISRLAEHIEDRFNEPAIVIDLT
mgnify:FL=1